MNNTSNVIILGTGPISLLKCYTLLKSSTIKSIRLIDSKNSIGGAWYVERKNNNNLETGCHIWSYCPEVYNFIQKELNINLIPFITKPIFKTKNINIPYTFKNTLDSYLFLMKGLLKFDISILKKIKISSKYYLNIFGKKNLYPLTGSFELINTLYSEIIKDSRVKIIMNTAIDSIIIDEKVKISSNNINFLTDKIFITSTTNINNFTLNKSNIKYEHTSINYIHYKIELNQKPLKIASYYRITNDQIIHRISDISYQIENIKNYLLIAIFEKAFSKMDESEIIKHIKSYLTDSKIITKSTSIEIDRIYQFPTYYSNQKTRDEINNLDENKIELLHSTDLMYGMHKLLKKENLI